MLEHFFNWSSLGDFIDKVGLSMTIWFVTIFLLYKIFYTFGLKIWDRFGPLVDAHFELVISMKDNLSKQTHLIEQTNETLCTNLQEQKDFLKNSKEILLEIKDYQKHSVEVLKEKNGNKE